MSVKVFRKRRGPDPVIGTDTTGSSGNFRVPSDVRHGTYYATSAKRAISTGICLATRSPNVSR
jgi:hypothetical protein